MKKILIFLAGMATMFILVVIFATMTNPTGNNGHPGLTLFEKDGQSIGAKQVKVMQVIEPNMALSHSTNKPDEIYDLDKILVLLLGDKNTSYYDDQIINIPKGKSLKHVGTFQYESKIRSKTVPAVEIK